MRPLRDAKQLLTKAPFAMRGSLEWRKEMAKAVTLAANMEFWQWYRSGGKTGMDPAHHFHIIFLGHGPLQKCIVEFWKGDYALARETAGAVLRFDAADTLSGASGDKPEGTLI